MTETDFGTPSTKYSSMRVYPFIDSATTFKGIKTAFLNDTSMGITKKTATTESYSALVNILDPQGEVVATVTCSGKNIDDVETGIAGINTAFAEDNLDDGYTGVRDTDKTKFSMTLNGLTAVGDKVKLKVTNAQADLIDYKVAATLDIIEDWADGVTALNAA